jgi:hypothetical protein
LSKGERNQTRSTAQKQTTMETIHELVKYYETGKREYLAKGSLQHCMNELNIWKFLARKNGADISSEDDFHMNCIDYAGNGTDVLFQIYDTQEQLFD